MQGFEKFLLDSIIHHPILDNIFYFFTSTLGDKGIIWIILGVCLLVYKPTRKVGLYTLLCLLAMQVVGNMVLKPIFMRTRPYLEYGLNVYGHHPPGTSFPSGHTFSSFIAALAISRYLPKWRIPTFTLAILISFGRLYFYYHYPTDVLASIVFAIILEQLMHQLFIRIKKQPS